jgi:hypothetical protein
MIHPKRENINIAFVKAEDDLIQSMPAPIVERVIRIGELLVVQPLEQVTDRPVRAV